jgi:hypothetical protein
VGNYNSHTPYILGEEWVPIRDEAVTFSPAVNAVELGHQFTLATARQVGTGRFYVSEPPTAKSNGQSFGMSVYARGTADETGPILRVVIPVSAVVTSGSWSFSTSTSAVDALWNPSDGRRIILTASGVGSGDQLLRAFCAVNQYDQLLFGKRILAVNLLYRGNFSRTTGTFQPYVLLQKASDPTGSSGVAFDILSLGPTAATDLETFNFPVQRMRFGDTNPYWNMAADQPERMPWTWTGLSQFNAGNAQAIDAGVYAGAVSATEVFSLQLDYMALEVIYCEELRLIVGASQYLALPSLLDADYGHVIRQGVNVLTMRTLAYAANPILAAGDYDLVVWSADPGDLDFQLGKSGTYPDLNALRELYQIPTHHGVEVDIPFPPEDNLEATFTQVETAVLPQLSLHATGSGAPLTEPHVYGRQGHAQVWGSNAATQEIYDDIVGVNTVYPQVRFYARRFGDTTVPLALTGTASLAGSAVSISVSDFDLLTEIVDGWKEVTLRFATPPTMGTLATPEPSWAWSASGEGKGNRWEILAGCAPAISGVPGNLYNQAPAASLLGSATYQPPAGATVELTWMPQGVASPYVSGASADQGCDAVLIFSQDPPTISGVALTGLTQTVTGIGLDCGSTPCCIPTGIGYQRVTWSATSLPASGFGGYELQRFDTTPGAAFQTIMLASSPFVTGFNDYEARVGVNSVYRIRALNILNFAGAWSLQVTGAPAAPGVSGACSDNTGALIFTSNSAQSGIYNAAYVMQWEREPAEDFTLPEAGQVQFQPMYQRDGSVAFHGTERGLEQFTRTLLIQAGAIDPIRLADVKTLRDLAWAQLPYVCVRDGVGDRWYANVRVPASRARNNRTRYFADVQITELTQTPYAVDPS